MLNLQIFDVVVVTDVNKKMPKIEFRINIVLSVSRKLFVTLEKSYCYLDT